MRNSIFLSTNFLLFFQFLNGMSVIHLDFQGPYKSLFQAKKELVSAQKHLDKVNELGGCLKPYDWYLNLCQAQEDLNEAHESIRSQFGEELYKKIVLKN